MVPRTGEISLFVITLCSNLPIGAQTVFSMKLRLQKTLTQNIKVGYPVIKCRATMLNVKKNEHFLPEENYRTGTSNEMDKTNYHPLDFKEHHRSKIPLP